MDGRMGGRMEGRACGQTGGRVGGPPDGQTDGGRGGRVGRGGWVGGWVDGSVDGSVDGQTDEQMPPHPASRAAKCFAPYKEARSQQGEARAAAREGACSLLRSAIGPQPAASPRSAKDRGQEASVPSSGSVRKHTSTGLGLCVYTRCPNSASSSTLRRGRAQPQTGAVQSCGPWDRGRQMACAQVGGSHT